MKLNTARIVICASVLLGAAGSSFVASAQDTDLEARYSALLQQIADTKMVIAQKEAYIGSQQAQIDSLSSQIEFVPGIKESVRPIVTQMTAEIEKVIKNDLPFLADERYARLDDLKADLADATIGESVLYRKAMTLYDIETNYGNTVGSYTGNNPVNPRSRLQACQESLSTTACAFTEDLTAVLNSGATLENLANEGDLNDGNYIHFGRLAFLYLQVDSSEGFRYDKESQSWEPLSQGEILGVRRSVRIARGESAAGVLTAPILVDPAP